MRQRRGWSQERLRRSVLAGVHTGDRLDGWKRASCNPVLAPKARIRKPELAQWRAGTRDSRFTPQEVLDRVAFVVGALDLNPVRASAEPGRGAALLF